MKLDNLKEKHGLISTSLLCASGVLGILVVVKLGSFFATSARMEKLVEEAITQSKPDPNEAKDYIAKFKEAADELKKNNMFAPPPPKPGWPVSRVEGILGDTAFINGGWHKVGDEIGGARVLEITPTYAKLVWEGQEKIFSPFDIKDVGTTKAEPRKGKPERTEAREDRGERRRPSPERGGRRSMRNMSREERSAMREKMRNMSREERREYMRKMREESEGQ